MEILSKGIVFALLSGFVSFTQTNLKAQRL